MTVGADPRRQLRAARRALDLHTQRRHAAQVAARLGAERRFRRARRIAFYWPSDGEVDVRPLMRRAWRAGKRCYLPVIRPFGRERRLWFLPWRPDRPLVRNRFGILEPQVRGERLRLAWQLDLLLVPLVAFDAACHRLGMGGGYYDRSLAFRHRRKRWRGPRLIGIAHECQRLERIEPRPWDVALDAVCTERCFYRHCT